MAVDQRFLHPTSAPLPPPRLAPEQTHPDCGSLGIPVALITMPFSYAKFPSIQLGTLSALLKAQGIGTQTFHGNLQFAHQIGAPLYDIICEKRGLFGEWLFSRMLFRDNPKHRLYPEVFQPIFEATAREAGCTAGFLQDIATTIAPRFLTSFLTQVDWGQFRIVGFTSTFDQNISSLTLAKLIKDLYPAVQIVFGGANFDGEMGLEYFRAFPWIDYVVSGEGEQVFPALVTHILRQAPGPPPAGVIHRQDGKIHFTPNEKLVMDFQHLPVPDYDDYFKEVTQLAGQSSTGLNRVLLYEGSRGCWWGQKHHCTFCGLNAQAMTFRAKSAEQVTAELDYLSSRYDTTRFRLVDNIIDMKFVDGLFGRLAERHIDLDVFMETKSNLTKRQIRTLAHGGVKCMQPGIESLSQNQLREMDKGVSPLQNIQCLKWSRYYNLDVSWNILLGFPHETDEDYERQLDLIPSLVHLQPPEATARFWLERFSPYFQWPERYGIRLTGPGLAYEYVYDKNQVDLQKIAYDFEYDLDWNVTPSLYERFTQSVDDWKQRYHSPNRPFLYFAKSLSYLTVFDGRHSTPTSERFDGASAYILEFCNDQPRSLEQIAQGLQDSGLLAAANTSIHSLTPLLQHLQTKRLLYAEGPRFFSLALPVNPHR